MTKARDLANIISGGFTADDIPNIDASKITTGSIADARIPASAVSQHATSFDDNKIVNDISTIALRQASNENKGAYNSNSMSVDVFQDATGIDTITNASRNASEYVSSKATTDTSVTINTSNYTTYFNTNTVHNTHNNTNFNRYDTGRVSTNDSWEYIFATGGSSNTFRHEFSANTNDRKDYQATWVDFGSGNSFQATNISLTFVGGQASHIGTFFEGYNTLPISTTAQPSDAERYINRTGSPATSNGTTISSGSMTGNNFNRYFSYLAQFSSGANNYSTINGLTFTGNLRQLIFNATGNFTGTTITAPSSVSEMGAIITYQDQAGTNALNTDIVLKLSADGGSNYSTATLVAMPDFSSGIKMAKVNDLSVTAGTSLKYKIEFANQASGSKEARIRGVSLQY